MAYFLNVVSYHAAESTVVVVFVLKKKNKNKATLVYFGLFMKVQNTLMGI